MKPEFEVKVTQFKVIDELPELWTEDKLKAILDDCGVDDLGHASRSEYLEYITLAFSDLEPTEAAEIVLKHHIGHRLNAGQIHEVAHSMMEDRIWEEYQDMSLHEELFVINSFLYKAYNGKFPHPDAAYIKLEVKASNTAGKAQIGAIDESFICRLIANGMTDHSILFRLFDEKLAGNLFEEAKDVIWQFNVPNVNNDSATIEIRTGLYWVKELKETDEFRAVAYRDGTLD